MSIAPDSLVLLAILAGSGFPARTAAAHRGFERPSHWGVPLHVAGAPNLHRVTPVFYRSAQPQKSGFQALSRDVGIKTVVTLRAFHSDRKKVIGTPLVVVSIPINTWNLKHAELVRALAEVEFASRRGAVLLHCLHGADRTGLVTALYRMINQDWNRTAALDEMRNGRFGFHAMWGNIPAFLAKVDADALRLEVAATVAALEADGIAARRYQRAS
jgi:protein tyrosine/serine phosphatase